jgi:hypothetical protein
MKHSKSRHAGESEEILRCQERNLVKQKYCVAELADPSAGREIMASLKPGAKGRKPSKHGSTQRAG